MCGALLVLMPVQFVLLPFSKRKANVQWRHVLRVALYSISPPMMVLFGALLVVLVTALQTMIASAVVPALAYGSAVPCLVVVFWWGTAIQRYMQIPRGWFVAILFAVIAVLVTGACIFWVDHLYGSDPWRV